MTGPAGIGGADVKAWSYNGTFTPDLFWEFNAFSEFPTYNRGASVSFYDNPNNGSHYSIIGSGPGIPGIVKYFQWPIGQTYVTDPPLYPSDWGVNVSY
jgi:hypothetical protein